MAMYLSKENVMRYHDVENNSKHTIITVIWVVLTLAVVVALFGTFLTAT